MVWFSYYQELIKYYFFFIGKTIRNHNNSCSESLCLVVGQNTHIIIESATQNTCRKDIFIEMLIFLLFLIEYHNDMMSRVMIKLRDPHCPGGYTFDIYTLLQIDLTQNLEELFMRSYKKILLVLVFLLKVRLSNKVSEMILWTGTREKFLEYDFCQHREYLVAVSHKLKSF